MTPFALDERIEAASLPLGETDFCLLRLMNDSRYPWVVLVPRRPATVELFDLTADDRRCLVEDASHLAAGMAAVFGAEKMNVGSLGNRVRQFHLHIIARRTGDPAWPDAVWNGSAAVPYEAADRDRVLAMLRPWLPARR